MNCLKAAAIDHSVPDEHKLVADFKQKSTPFKRLAEHLDYCRQQHKTATYLEVADAIDIQPPQRIHRLTQLLEALMEFDQKHQQPLRSALVVSRISAGLPAQGFFLKAQALGLMSAVVTAEEFHQQCLKRLFNGSTTSKT